MCGGEVGVSPPGILIPKTKDFQQCRKEMEINKSGTPPESCGLAVAQDSGRVIHRHFPFSESLPLKAYFKTHMH